MTLTSVTLRFCILAMAVTIQFSNPVYACVWFALMLVIMYEDFVTKENL